MSRVAIVLYRPGKGKEEELVEHLRGAFPMMRRNGFITDRKATGMKTKDGRLIVVFEWTSEEAIERAGEHPEVQEKWMEVDRLSAFDRAASVPEFQRSLPDFEYINIE
jgi:heme-degrading monooxygenase HmoA